MATVPGPNPDRPLPRPGSPAERPLETEEDDRRESLPEERPAWEPEPYDPRRELAEPELPAAIP